MRKTSDNYPCRFLAVPILFFGPRPFLTGPLHFPQWLYIDGFCVVYTVTSQIQASTHMYVCVYVIYIYIYRIVYIYIEYILHLISINSTYFSVKLRLRLDETIKPTPECSRQDTNKSDQNCMTCSGMPCLGRQCRVPLTRLVAVGPFQPQAADGAHAPRGRNTKPNMAV